MSFDQSANGYSRHFLNHGVKLFNVRIVFLAMIIILTVILRLPGIGESLWYDETWYTTVQIGTLKTFAWTILSDVHPPAYTTLMFLWIHVFGDSEVSIRLPSLLAGIATIPLTYAVCKQMFGWKTAMLAAALISVSPPHIWYSQEAKQPALLVLSLFVGIYANFSVRNSPHKEKWSIIYFISMLFSALTYYYATVYIGTLLVMDLLSFRKTNKRIVIGNIVILALVALYIVCKIAFGDFPTGADYLRRFDMFELWMTLLNWFPTGNAIWPVDMWNMDFGILLRNPIMMVVHLILLLLVIVGMVNSIRLSGGAERKVRVDFLALFLSLPAFLFFLAFLGFNNNFQERSLLTLLPFFFAYLAYGIVSVRIPSLQATSSLVLVAMVVTSLVNYFRKDDEWTVYKPNPDWRAATGYLTKEFDVNPDGKLLVATSPTNVLAYYDSRFRGKSLAAFVKNRNPVVFKVLTINKMTELSSVLDGERVYLVHEIYWSGLFDRVRARFERCMGMTLENVYSAKGIEILKFRNSPLPDGGRELGATDCS